MFPALFVPHGAPTFALDPGEAGRALARLSAELPPPRAILVVSPHWDSAAPTVGGALSPETIHDYAGFPRELYALRYPAAGQYALASLARDLLEDAGFAAAIDLGRGLDHGAWVPLRYLYPAADVPVVPLSVQSRLGPSHHLAVGQALAPLLADGVLLVASGNLTHNLGDFMRHLHGAAAPGYVQQFPDWVSAQLADGDLEALLDYRRRAPGAREAHPSEEHLLPLFVALGAAGEGCTARAAHRGIADGVLAMDSFIFTPAAPAASRAAEAASLAPQASSLAAPAAPIHERKSA
jgi:4,5-DOPA dioxygenase extradiol